MECCTIDPQRHTERLCRVWLRRPGWRRRPLLSSSRLALETERLKRSLIAPVLMRPQLSVDREPYSKSGASNLHQEIGRPRAGTMPCHHIKALIHTSAALQRLHDKVPTDYFTLSWLMSRLRRRSNGIVMLLLALVAIAPGVSIVAGLLLMIPAFQMIAGKPAPIFPRRIALHPLPSRHFAALVQRGVPILRYLEKIIHPRWPAPLEATKRLVV